MVRLNAVEVLALAAAGVALGEFLRARVALLRRLSIPAPVAGGLVFALVLLVLRDRWLNVELDTSLRDLAMVAFFTSIGMAASWKRIRAGGAAVLLFLALATLGAVLQNLLGIALARGFGLNPLLGIVSGAVALAGGPATALAFGGTFERLGVAGAGALGLASATFGITIAGLFSGYVGERLIVRGGLKPGPDAGPRAAAAFAGHTRLLPATLALAIAMGLGSVLSAALERTGAVLPAYIGAMVAAAVLRNLDDRVGGRIPEGTVAALGNVALYLFIVMALATLRLWELARLALPLLAMLAAQVALAGALCALCYRAMGRGYESAVMTAGYSGFMLGTTANAVAAMDELERSHGPAPRAFLVVPLTGGFLIDFTNALVITTMANWLL